MLWRMAWNETSKILFTSMLTKGSKAAKRRTNLPQSLAGRTYRYDKDTLVRPIEISPKSQHWQDLPVNQRHTRNYRLMYLRSGVKGKQVYAHERLAELLRGKTEQ